MAAGVGAGRAVRRTDRAAVQRGDGPARRHAAPLVGCRDVEADAVNPRAAARPATKPKKAAKKRRKPADPVKAWANYLRRYRPGLPRYVLDELTGVYGEQVWESRLDPTSELILTILTQNTADVNAEKAYEALRARLPQRPRAGGPQAGHRLGRRRAVDRRRRPTGRRSSSRRCPSSSTSSGRAASGRRRRPGSRRRCATSASSAATTRLEFLGELPALEARDWLTADRRHRQEDRLDRAAVLLRHAADARRPPRRARLDSASGCIPPKATADQAHDLFLGLLEPDEMYAAHVLLIHHGRVICHAQNPKHDAVPGPRPVPVRRPQGALTAPPRERPVTNAILDSTLHDLLRVGLRQLARPRPAATASPSTTTASTTCRPTPSGGATPTPGRTSAGWSASARSPPTGSRSRSTTPSTATSRAPSCAGG